MPKTEIKCSPVSERLHAIVVAREHAEMARLLRNKGSVIMAELFEENARALNKALDETAHA